MLTASLSNSYRKNGKKVYVYKVDSNKPAELEQYKQLQGDNHRTENPDGTGKSLYFLGEFDAAGRKRLIQPVIKLTITINNRIVVDDTAAEQKLMREIESHQAVEIAKAMAQQWISAPNQTVAAPVATPKPAVLPSPDEMNENIEQGVGAKAQVGAGVEDIDA